jgi:hypothetical protein
LTPPEPVLANSTVHEPPSPLTFAPAHPAPSPADDAVAALFQSLINEYKVLPDGLEVQHKKALAVEGSKYEARTTADAPRRSTTCYFYMGRGTAPATALVVEDEDGTVIPPLVEKPKKCKKKAFSTAGTRLFALSRVTLIPCTSASVLRKPLLSG